MPGESDFRTVAIAGVGLIGGSFALALRKAGFQGRILGVSSPVTITEALRLGVVDEGVTLAEASAQADLLYLAQPVLKIIETLHALVPLVRPEMLVTDAGSTKRRIVEAATALPCQFVGGHPMAGKESRGVAEASGALFEDRPYILTVRHESELATPAACSLISWIERIGSHVRLMTPSQHDRILAYLSHGPQMVSTTLACVADCTSEAVGISGPGLLDMTRLAMSSYDVWRDILATNGDQIDHCLQAVIDELQAIQRDLQASNMSVRFEKAARFARALRAERT